MGVRGLSARAVFLDRDGTLNRAFIRDGVSGPPSSIHELHLLPGVVDGVTRLKQHGFVLVVVTNQPDVARGTVPRSIVDGLNAEIQRRLPCLDAIFTCFHDDADRCECRKPRAGMLLAAAAQYGVDLGSSYLIGDSWKDVAAGNRVGCQTIQLRSEAASLEGDAQPTVRVDSFRAATDWVLARESTLTRMRAVPYSRDEASTHLAGL